MLDLDRIKIALKRDMDEGVLALSDDLLVRTASMCATSAIAIFFIPWQWVAMVVMAIACAELIEKICVHIAKRSFSLAVYVIWMMCNQMVLAAICSMAMMLVVEPSVTGKLVGLMILIGCMSQPLMVGVSSIALSYGCLIIPLAIGWCMALVIGSTEDSLALLVLGLSVLSLRTVLVTHSTRSVMQARNNAQAKADEAAIAKTRFMTAISHEIRTPLNGILGIAELTRDKAQTEDEKHQADILISTSENLKNLLDDVLDQAKIEAGQMQLTYAAGDVRALVRQTSSLFQANAQAKHVELRTEFRPEESQMFVMMDRLRMGQILSNLVSNAIKFTDQGSIVIKACLHAHPKLGHELELRVCDTGRGMTKGEAARLFQDFAQVDDQQHRAAKGTGLGLSISRGLALAMNGDLTVRSELGKGSEFVLTLPCTRVERLADAPTTRGSEIPDLAGWRILAVDDNKTNCYIVSKFLAQTKATVLVANGGLAALEVLKEQEQDVVLLDISMPDMDGPTVFDQMQSLSSMSYMPKVIALTAHTHADARRNYRRMGMDGYLSKPLKKSRLFDELGRLGVKSPKPNPHKI